MDRYQLGNAGMKRHRLRFTLSTLLLATAVLCAVLSLVAPGLRARVRVGFLGGDIGGTTVVLSHRKVSNRDLEIISALRCTEVIWLNGTNVDDDALQWLARMRRLKVVMLDGTATSATGLRHLEGLPIEWLDIRDTLVADDALDTLLKLKALKQLNLRGSKLSDKSVRRIKLCLRDCELDI